jgi:hypothetical protein
VAEDKDREAKITATRAELNKLIHENGAVAVLVFKDTPGTEQIGLKMYCFKNGSPDKDAAYAAMLGAGLYSIAGQLTPQQLLGSVHPEVAEQLMGNAEEVVQADRDTELTADTPVVGRA